MLRSFCRYISTVSTATHAQRSFSGALRKGRFTPEETRRLLEAHEIFKDIGYGKWVKISQYVGTRSEVQCNHFYNRRMVRRKTGRWSEAEVKRFEDALRRYGHGNWKDISIYLGKLRTDIQCNQKAKAISFSTNHSLNFGYWSKFEDVMLLEAVERLKPFHTVMNMHFWRLVAKHVLVRSESQCRQRYLRICPMYDRSALSQEEFERLNSLVRLYGRRWKEFEKHFERRSALQLSMEWYNFRRKLKLS